VIDYERAKRNNPKLKAALTRAMKVSDPLKRSEAVIAACRKAVQEWNEWGAWPDNWSHWQRALSDSLLKARYAGDNQMHVGVNQLEDLA
jgi:hypothetical protein